MKDNKDRLSLSHQVSTRQYRAPELFFGDRKYGYSLDLWSLGVILLELSSLRCLFTSHNEIDQMYKLFQIMGSPTEENWPVSSFSFSFIFSFSLYIYLFITLCFNTFFL